VNFASLGLPQAILKGIRAAGYTEATAVQSKAIPIIVQGNDLIGIAQSGSGKTGAYAIPLLARLIDGTSPRLRAIVLVPTREMAAYVETRCRDYARYADLRIQVVYTGAPLAQQERALRDQGADLLVATPGRLLELQARDCLDFADVEMLVLDEADKLVQLGLGPDVRKLLKLLPETRQTVMFTLNMPPELNRLAKEALIEPLRVDVGVAAKPSAGIRQAVYPVPRDLKPDLLDEILSQMEVRSTTVFTRSRTAAERISRHLVKRGYTVSLLDEHPGQDLREGALEDLKRGRSQILVASHAAARSLDVAGVAHVVNFEVPQTPEDYAHRIGRQGRADAVGAASTLMSPDEQRDVEAIERFLGRAIARVTLPDFDYAMVPSDARKLAMPEAPGMAAARGAIESHRAANLASRPAPPTAKPGVPAKPAAPLKPGVPVKPSAPARVTVPAKSAAPARPVATARPATKKPPRAKSAARPIKKK
jgi:ATP-dependent RNA helicase RhlE